MADLEVVALDVRDAARAWSPGIRIIGNVRASDIAALADDYLALRTRLAAAEERAAKAERERDEERDAARAEAARYRAALKRLVGATTFSMMARDPDVDEDTRVARGFEALEKLTDALRFATAALDGKESSGG